MVGLLVSTAGIDFATKGRLVGVLKHMKTETFAGWNSSYSPGKQRSPESTVPVPVFDGVGLVPGVVLGVPPKVRCIHGENVVKLVSIRRLRGGVGERSGSVFLF